MPADEEFMQKLLAAFRVEAAEHIQAMSKGLVEIEQAADAAARRPMVETIFREAHSLKGAARAVSLLEIESICQGIESVFARWKRGEAEPAAEEFDVMHEAVDALERIMAAPEGTSAGVVAGLLAKLEGLKQGAPRKDAAQRGGGAPPARGRVGVPPPVVPEGAAPPEPARGGDAAGTTGGETPPLRAERPRPEPPRPVAPETIRVATAKLDALLLEVEEMVSLKLVASHRATDLREATGAMEKWRKQWTKFAAEFRTVETAAAPRLREFVEASQGHLKAIEERLAALTKSAEQDRRAVGGSVDSLLENTKKLVMLPFSTLLDAFPKLVRDLARDEAREVALEMRGGDVQLDKRVLEELKDPLVHLLRNAVDHGIEKPGRRAECGKPARGRIEIAVAQVDGSTVEVLVADDGGGIDPAEVTQAAIKHGVLREEDAAALDEHERLMLIFKSDVSTSPIITQVSGRGLGMAIVREKVEKLGGRVSLKTEPGRGTTFRILVPLTMSTFRGILLEVRGQLFVVPTSNVERVTRIKTAEIHTVENRESIAINGRALAFVRLGDVLEVPARESESRDGDWRAVVVLAAAQQRVAFAVDRVLDEQEVLVKPLGKPLVRVRNVAGATVLGSGQPVPILHVPDLLKSATLTTRSGAAPVAAEARQKSVLVAEDSITSRMLLKNILESAGFDVRTAVDGMDAWTLLRTERFDLVVSDVEMPRMGGFDLTARIRADKKLGELPVVLVTAREAREDRERGIDVGANAYVVKSSFDQSNLLEVIGRLL